MVSTYLSIFSIQRNEMMVNHNLPEKKHKVKNETSILCLQVEANCETRLRLGGLYSRVKGNENEREDRARKRVRVTKSAREREV